MAKHNQFRQEHPITPSKLPLHPIWRGIGCIFIIIVPVISYFLSSLLIKSKNDFPWLIIPNDLVFVQLHDPYLAVKILYAGLLTLIIGAVLAIVTFITNRLFAPSRYGPYDIPPDKVNKLKK